MSLRSALLTALPKVALSRACGVLTTIPLPRRCRAPLFRWFAARYGACLEDVEGDLACFRSLQQFFRRPLHADARPIAGADLVWPCDGRIVTTGSLSSGRIEQIKGQTYALVDLVGDAELAASLTGGRQATIYLAPGDYHRVHSPFRATIDHVTALPGTLFPVNPPAVRCIRDLFARNARHVFACTLPGGVRAAVVMVGAYNVGGTLITRTGGEVAPGEEIGQFGFGSTTIVLIGKGGPPVPEVGPETRLRMGQAMASSGCDPTS
ncbi:MAG: phosphatidylserine decarboxylase [Planctomycetes bacterium]|nr:phosphatidylserine decarboxylase [Planctomycetota bacterium]